MKSYQIPLQAPYVACAATLFSSFILREGEWYENVLKEVDDYFGVGKEHVARVFNTCWGMDGIKTFETDLEANSADVLLLVVTRAFDLLGIKIEDNQLSKWLQSPEVLRKGILPMHIKRLKVKVKKMSLVWKAEG